jgi:Fe2+ or Zn2+ uptake regulation protein
VKSPDELTDLFRSQGLKVTPQRQRIFRALYGTDEHPTAEAVHEAVTVDMPTVSLRTVYQTLNDLAAMGEIQHLDLGTGSSRFDPNLDAHHHLVCDECGKVHDVYVDFTDLQVPIDIDRGFLVTNTEVVFRGRCASCATDSDDERGPQTNQEKQPKETSTHA